LKFIAYHIYCQKNETTEGHRIKYDTRKKIAKPSFIPLGGGVYKRGCVVLFTTLILEGIDGIR
jgi:hypothetical protein